MVQWNIEVDLSQLQQLKDAFSKGMTEAGLPNTANAFRESAEMVNNAWVDYLNGKTSLDGIEKLDKVNSSIAQSVKTRKKGDFDYTVSSDNKELEKLTQRTDPVYYDMKQTHPYGKKSRVSKKGIPYLIIPFRWGTPNGKKTKRAHFNNFIPQKNYKTNILAMSLSFTTGLRHIEANFKGQAIDRAEYKWGNRLTEDQAWNSRSVGMVRMKDVNHSTYFTFRIISAKSPVGSWLYWKDGKAGVDIIGGLKRTLEGKITKTIETGLKADEDDYRNS